MFLNCFRTKEGQGREYTEDDREYVPAIPTPPLPRRRRTRGAVKTRASSVPISIPRKNKKRMLPVIDEESGDAVNGDLDKELEDVNTENLQEKPEMFDGVLPTGVLPRFVCLQGKRL